MPMDFTRTERGFAISSFTDRYGAQCSLQKSSLAFEEAIWLGVDEVEGKPARMHLTQEMVAALLPALTHFIETGELPTVA